MSNINQQPNKIRDKPGFVAAVLDQSGGSTLKALAVYGIDYTQGN